MSRRSPGTDSGRRSPRRQPRRRLRRPSPFVSSSLVGAALAATIAGLLRLETGLSWLLSYLAGINATTFGLYAHDKIMARLGKRRVPEATLHVFEAVGGTPAALLAQQVLRHKTVKRGYRAVFWTLVAAQVALVSWALWQRRG